MYTETLQVKLSPKLLARLEAFAEERGVHRQEIARRCIDEGLADGGEARVMRAPAATAAVLEVEQYVEACRDEDAGAAVRAYVEPSGEGSDSHAFACRVVRALAHVKSQYVPGGCVKRDVGHELRDWVLDAVRETTVGEDGEDLTTRSARGLLHDMRSRRYMVFREEDVRAVEEYVAMERDDRRLVLGLIGGLPPVPAGYEPRSTSRPAARE